MSDDERRRIDEANRRYAERLAKNREAHAQKLEKDRGAHEGPQREAAKHAAKFARDNRGSDAIREEHLQTIVGAADPKPREILNAKKSAEEVPAHLAEAQVSLAPRCTVCGNPVIGRDVPRDRQGRPRHHRCPP
jgi:hypothetical protein